MEKEVDLKRKKNVGVNDSLIGDHEGESRTGAEGWAVRPSGIPGNHPLVSNYKTNSKKEQ